MRESNKTIDSNEAKNVTSADRDVYTNISTQENNDNS